MEILKRILNWIHRRCARARRRAVSDGASSSFHCCSRDRRDACFTVSTDSAGLFGRATIPLPAILVLSHTQVWLPALHKLESRSDLRADAEYRQQAATDQFKFSQETSVRVLVLVGGLEPDSSSWVSHDTLFQFGILSQYLSGWVTLIDCPLAVTNALELGTTSRSNDY